MFEKMFEFSVVLSNLLLTPMFSFEKKKKDCYLFFCDLYSSVSNFLLK